MVYCAPRNCGTNTGASSARRAGPADSRAATARKRSDFILTPWRRGPCFRGKAHGGTRVWHVNVNEVPAPETERPPCGGLSSKHPTADQPPREAFLRSFSV